MIPRREYHKIVSLRKSGIPTVKITDLILTAELQSVATPNPDYITKLAQEIDNFYTEVANEKAD